MFSSLEFCDDAIYATDIALSGAKVGLVTLSACDTGTMSLVTREEPDGLARAFWRAGRITWWQVHGLSMTRRPLSHTALSTKV